MLRTCNTTEIPPNPSKNEQITIFIDIFLLTIEAIEQTPFVSSISPVKIPFTYLEERPKIFKIGERKLATKSKEPLLFKIEIAQQIHQ